MNKHAHRVIFSQHLGQLVVVGENATAQGKSATGERGAPAAVAQASTGGFYLGALRSIFAAGLLCVGGLGMVGQAQALDANALPDVQKVVRGEVNHSVSGSTMNIVQTTNRAVVNYNSFNIGSAATVNHSGGVMLARVTGAGASRIEGTLNTSGMVLVNPNGIAIGSTANINAGSFTASTLNVTDDNFMAGNMVFERNGATGSVINAGGTIKQLDNLGTEGGGYVALVGASVSNSGTITTQGGDVVLAAADKVTINAPQTSPSTVGVPLSQRVRLELAPEALQSATVDNSGVIVTEGGHVLMRAAAIVDAVSQVAQARVTHSGSIDTTGEQGGRVDILADKGIVRVSGSITANSTNGSAGGDIYIGRDEHTNVLAAVGDASGARLESQGGFVETSGSYLVTTGTRVRAKDWLLDPTDITIVESLTGTQTPFTNANGTNTYENTSESAPAESEILASDIVNALRVGTNVLIRTTSGGSGHGDITVASNIIVQDKENTNSKDATLTLQAERNIVLNQGVSISRGGSNRLHVVLNSDFDGNGAGAVILNLGSSIVTNGGNLSIGGGSAGDASGYAQGYARQIYGVSINGATLNTGLGDIAIRGRSNQNTGAGVYIRNTTILSANQHTSTPTLVNGRNVTIDGVAQVGAEFNATGVLFDIYSGGTTTNGSVRIDALADLNVLGHLGGGGTGSAIRVANTWTGADYGAALLLNASGSGTLHGIQTDNADNTSSAIRLTGFRLNTVGDARILAEAANSNSIAIGLIRTDGTLRFFSDNWRMQVRSFDGDVRIQSNQGAILGMDTAGGVNISGRHVIIDNTGAGMTVAGVPYANGGSINSSTGEIVLGSGTSTFTTLQTNGWAGSWVPLGVSLGHVGNVGNSLAGITATNRLTIGSSSNSGNGINVFGASTVAGNIHLAGRTTLAEAHGVNIGAALTSTNGNISLTGSATTGNGMLIGSSLTAKLGTVRLIGAVSSSSINTLFNIQQKLTGVITANQLEVLGGRADLSAAINKVNVLAAQVKDSIDFVNGKALTIGTVNSTEGITTTGVRSDAEAAAVLIETTTGNLTLANSISTASSGEAAVVLMAGSAKAPAEPGGGNVVVKNNSIINMAEGGQALIFTGSVNDSVGLQSLAGGPGSGRYRYNSGFNASGDFVQNFTKLLDDIGVSVIYREAPVIRLSIDNKTKAADGQPFTAFTAQLASGEMKNGDTPTSAATFAGPAIGAVEVGPFEILGVENTQTTQSPISALGYRVSYENSGVLTITEPLPNPPNPNPAPTPNPPAPPVPDNGGGTGGGSSVVPFGDNPFELASAADLLESDVCSVDNLAACFCEEAKDELGKPLSGLNVCSPEKLRTQIQ